VPADAFLFAKELQIAQRSNFATTGWCDHAGRAGRAAEIPRGTQNGFSMNCTVSVVLFCEGFTGAEDYEQREGAVQCDRSA